MGVPGPMRAKVSFGAGLRFSVGRRHRLNLFCDEKGAARSRITGQPVEYLDPTGMTPDGNASAWVAFVDRHWGRADCVGLARRTSRPFTDLTLSARERIGTLYNAIDAIPCASDLDLLVLAADHIRIGASGVEEEIRTELVTKTQRTLQERLTNLHRPDEQPLWPRLVSFWRQSDAAFAQPLIETALYSLLKENPLTAAEAALEVAADFPIVMDRERHERLIDEVIGRVSAYLPRDVDLERLTNLCTRWRSVRPADPAIGKLIERCSAPPIAVLMSP